MLLKSIIQIRSLGSKKLYYSNFVTCTIGSNWHLLPYYTLAKKLARVYSSYRYTLAITYISNDLWYYIWKHNILFAVKIQKFYLKFKKSFPVIIKLVPLHGFNKNNQNLLKNLQSTFDKVFIQL